MFYDIIKDKYFGYTHIDNDVKSNNQWFGIYIDKLYRKQGFGNLFLNYTLNHYKINNNVTDIHLSVDIENTNAIKLYEKNNFVTYNNSNNVIYMKRINM